MDKRAARDDHSGDSSFLLSTEQLVGGYDIFYLMSAYRSNDGLVVLILGLRFVDNQTALMSSISARLVCKL